MTISIHAHDVFVPFTPDLQEDVAANGSDGFLEFLQVANVRPVRTDDDVTRPQSPAGQSAVGGQFGDHDAAQALRALLYMT